MSRASVSSPTRSSMPTACARVSSTAIVCGWQLIDTKNEDDGLPLLRRHISIASAAAVASSSSEALATGSPVRSHTIVWKFSIPSSRPCAISA
jgi:hypothetical protein